jgi:Cys-tRNA(Pro)/Cys-tRNA(Cys) deacylase
MVKNNVTRLLDLHKVPYTVHELPAEKIGAQQGAQLLGMDPARIYKTIVVTRAGRGKPVLALVPGHAEVDLKALAQVLGEKKLHLPTERQAEQLTGLQAGGISPLALLNRGFQVVLDRSALACGEICVSGGQRGLNVCLPATSLVSLTHALVEAIAGPIP